MAKDKLSYFTGRIWDIQRFQLAHTGARYTSTKSLLSPRKKDIEKKVYVKIEINSKQRNPLVKHFTKENSPNFIQ